MNDAIFHSRAVPTHRDLQNDADVMVHQQLARLFFFEKEVGTKGKSVLDFGCGSGFNCHLLYNAAQVVGFDKSLDAITLARQLFPNCQFQVADGCDASLALGQFERIICCEVLEHVPEMSQFITNIAHHLTDDGVALITTPNVAVFSNGHRPSPMNREHIYELDIEEFRNLLQPFSHVRIFGQRFTRRELADEWTREVEQKIGLLEAGVRWPNRNPPPRILTAIHSLPPIRWGWRQFRWRLIEGIRNRRATKNRPYDFSDFEFIEGRVEDALWFCAIVSR